MKPNSTSVAVLAAALGLVDASFVAAGVGHWSSSGPVGSPIASLAIDPGTPSVVYAASFGGGFFKSDDAGAHWAQQLAGPASTGATTAAPTGRRSRPG